MRVIPSEVFNESGKMERIEFYNEYGVFEVQAEWDESDPNDEEHRQKFREWAYRIVEQIENGKYEVEK